MHCARPGRRRPRTRPLRGLIRSRDASSPLIAVDALGGRHHASEPIHRQRRYIHESLHELIDAPSQPVAEDRD